MAEIEVESGTAGCDMVISRRVKAARERVFDAFIDPAHIGQWWGPNGFTTTIDEMDVRVGGAWRFTMHGADGTDYRNRIEYTELARPARLCYEHGDDAAPHFRTEITFEEQQGGTLVTLRLICNTRQQLEEMKKFGAEQGGEQTLARLERYLAGYGSEM